VVVEERVLYGYHMLLSALYAVLSLTPFLPPSEMCVPQVAARNL
jgi:hypothetical protein